MRDKTMSRAKPEELWPSHLPRDFKKKVAIYGGGYTRQLILDHPLVDDDCEIWSGNHVWNKDGWGADCPRLDRVFDIHETSLLETYPGEADKEHFKWLQQEHSFPIFMLNPDGRFPSAIRYPIEEVTLEIFSKVYRGNKPKAAYGSSIDFMAALAMYEGYDWIGYFGIEMQSGTEYKYQIPDAHFHLGFAAGRGITTWVPDDPRSSLLRREVYSYEGFQMVSRQTLEKHYYEYEKQRREWVDAANTWVGGYRHLTGQIAEARDNGGLTPEMEAHAVETGNKVRRAREAAAMAAGCMYAIKALIQVTDLEEPDTEIYVGLFDEIPLEDLRP